MSIVALEDGDAWSVTVEWSRPAVTPDTYNVTLRANRIDTLLVDGVSYYLLTDENDNTNFDRCNTQHI